MGVGHPARVREIREVAAYTHAPDTGSPEGVITGPGDAGGEGVRTKSIPNTSCPSSTLTMEG